MHVLFRFRVIVHNNALVTITIIVTITGIDILQPLFDPCDDPRHVLFQVFHRVAFQLYDDPGWIGFPRFVGDDAHDLCFVVFLNFLEWVTPGGGEARRLL